MKRMFHIFGLITLSTISITVHALDDVKSDSEVRSSVGESEEIQLAVDIALGDSTEVRVSSDLANATAAQAEESAREAFQEMHYGFGLFKKDIRDYDSYKVDIGKLQTSLKKSRLASNSTIDIVNVASQEINKAQESCTTLKNLTSDAEILAVTKTLECRLEQDTRNLMKSLKRATAAAEFREALLTDRWDERAYEHRCDACCHPYGCECVVCCPCCGAYGPRWLCILCLPCCDRPPCVLL